MLGSFSSGNIGFGVLLSAQDAFSANFQKFRNELRLTNAATADFSNKLSRTASSFAVFSGLSLGIVGIGALIKEVTTLAGEYEQLEIAIKSMSGSVAVGNSLIADLREFSLQSPLNFKDTIEQTKRLMAYGLEVKDVMRDMRMLTEISAGVGLDKFPFLALAYGQTLGGTITGQEINQFSNAGVGIYKELDKIRGWKPGTARSQTAKALTPEIIREVLMSLVNEGGNFHKLMEKQLNSWAGQVNRMKESIYFLKVDIGRVISSRYLSGLKRLNSLTNKMNEFMQSKRGNATIQSFLKLFEVIAATTLIVTLFTAIKLMGLLTGFLLPTAVKQTYMLALANNQLGRAFGVMFGSFFRGIGILFNTVFLLGRIAFFAFVAHKALQKMFGTNYINDFWNILSGAFELIQNYNPATGKSLLSDETLKVLGGIKGGLPLAVKLFVIFADIRRIVVGIGQGIMWVLDKFYSVLAVVGNIFLKIAKIFGFFKQSDDVVGGGFMNDSAALNIGRLIGFIIGLKMVYKLGKMIYSAFVGVNTVLKAVRLGWRNSIDGVKTKKNAFFNSNLVKETGYAFNSLKEKAKIAFTAMAKSIKQGFKNVWLYAQIVGDVLKDKFKTVAQSIKKSFKDAFSYINTVLKSFLGAIKNGFSRLGNYLKDPLKNRLKPFTPDYDFAYKKERVRGRKSKKDRREITGFNMVSGFADIDGNKKKNYNLPILRKGLLNLHLRSRLLKDSLRSAFNVFKDSKVGKGLQSFGNALLRMKTSTSDMYKNMKSRFPAIGSMFSTIGGKIGNLSRGIKSMVSSMRLATIASRIWSFVTGRGLQIVGKGFKMLTSKIFLIVTGLLLTLGLVLAISKKLKSGELKWYDLVPKSGVGTGKKIGKSIKDGFIGMFPEPKKSSDPYTISPPSSRSDISPVTKSKDGKSYSEWKYTGKPKPYTERVISETPVIIKIDERVIGEAILKYMNKSDEKK